MNLFYYPDIETDKLCLSEEESRHCIKVLRLNKGDLVYITDGNGIMYKTCIIDANYKKCLIEIIEKITEFNKRNYYLHIALALTKNIDRFEWFLEKATEIGVDKITPIICENSERKTAKPERLEKIIISAMKQSLNLYKPELNNLVKFEKFIQPVPASENNFIAYCEEKEIVHLKDVYQPVKPSVILIGPEGDFTCKEIVLAKNNGFRTVSLGKNRLRTETAGVYACCLVNIINLK